MTPRVDHVLFYAAGFLFAAYVGSRMVQRVLRTIPLKDSATLDYTATMLGLVEITVYFWAWLTDARPVVAVWLVLKVAHHWKKPERDDPRRVFNRWLIGTGLSLAFAVAGAEAVTSAKAGDWWAAIGLPALLSVGAWMLARYGQRAKPS